MGAWPGWLIKHPVACLLGLTDKDKVIHQDIGGLLSLMDINLGHKAANVLGRGLKGQSRMIGS